MSDTPEKIAAERAREFLAKAWAVHITKLEADDKLRKCQSCEAVNLETLHDFIAETMEAYAQGPRADAGVLEIDALTAVIAKASLRTMHLSNPLQIARVIANDVVSHFNLAESALSQPQEGKWPIDRPCSACSDGDLEMKYHNHSIPASGKWDAYMLEHGREEYGLPQSDYAECDGLQLFAGMLCAKCGKPIALRHVMEGDGTHTAVPFAYTPPRYDAVTQEGFAKLDEMAAPQPTAEGCVG